MLRHLEVESDGDAWSTTLHEALLEDDRARSAEDRAPRWVMPGVRATAAIDTPAPLVG